MKTTNSANATVNNLFDGVQSIQKIFLIDAIKDCLRTSKQIIRVNARKDCSIFFDNVINYVVTHPSCNKYCNGKSVLEGFSKYGINYGEDLINAINNNREQLKKLGFAVSKIRQNKKSDYKKYKVFGKTSADGMDIKRTIAVRSKYGNYPVMFYDNYIGVVSGGAQMTAIKTDYHYATGCNYYDARPILYTTWLRLPVEKQNGTVTADKSDF